MGIASVIIFLSYGSDAQSRSGFYMFFLGGSASQRNGVTDW